MGPAMLEILKFTLFTIFFFALETIYFRIARKYNIVDHPNFRSSHDAPTLRGGGILFPLGLLIFAFFEGFNYPYFIAGLLIIGLISFLDDIQPVQNKVRIFIHLIAVSLLFVETELLNQSAWVVVIAYIVVIGTINAYNFMDGINGLTAAYSLVTCVAFLFINENVAQFIPSWWLVIVIIVVTVFGFFNFRVVAKCFAGDVGSVSIAFILIFFMLMLILATREIKYIGLFLIYGLDTVTTIIFRLCRKENIFAAHRSHFYQFLSNNGIWSQLSVSALYSITQGLINILILQSFFDLGWFIFLLITSGCVLIFIRFMVEGKDRLFKSGIDIP